MRCPSGATELELGYICAHVLYSRGIWSSIKKSFLDKQWIGAPFLVDSLVFSISERMIKGGRSRGWERERPTVALCLMNWDQMPHTALPSLRLTFGDNQHPVKSTLSVKSKFLPLMVIGLKDHQNCVPIPQPSEMKCPHETEDDLLITKGTARLHRQLWIPLHTQ